MRWLARRSEPDVSPSENGLYLLAGRQADLPLSEVVVHFRDLVSADLEWANSRNARYRRVTSQVRVASITLAALSTVVLGISGFQFQTEVALPMVAGVTVLGALEGFFNWRSRWVVMEETKYRLNRLRDEMDYYLMVTPPEAVTREALDRFFEDQQRIWHDVSRRWIELPSLDTVEPGSRTISPNPSGG
ncbi:DUF4231 domain-containing protein [Micromonospora profundi]|uniref:DUF4231 domain-containing protein n=1 Tax=Micromonospora profundi TaxID=1420889 RepID=UPI0033B0C431